MEKKLSFGKVMLACVLGVLIVSVIGALVKFIMMLAMISSLSGKPVTAVEANSFLTIDLSHITGDRAANSLMQTFNSDRTVGLIPAINAIREAATDNNIKGILIKESNGATISWASMEELRNAIEAFRQSGKPVVSYATSYSQHGYYLATSADLISLHPSGMLDFRGMGGEVMYYKDLLDQLGIEMQLIRPESCAYKSAGEVYSLSHMSDANREQIRAYISSIWCSVTKAIAKSRHIEADELNKIADDLSGYLADDACAHHLVDTLCFEEDVRNMLKENYGGEHLLPIEDYAENFQTSNQTIKQSSNQIAVIYAEGNVMDGSAKGFNEGVYGDDIVKALREAMNDEKVKAIVLRINSPGGAATASESMTHAVIAAKAKKPVIVSMGDLAASAGYEMSCMADVIVAQPMTITGSIGVFGTIPNVQKLLNQKLGLHTDTVATNRNANGLTILRPLSPTAMAMMTRNVEDFYKVFVGRVAEGRHMTYDEVHKIARGRVWTGADAIKIGLVDTLGGLDLALSIAAEKADITDYTVKDFPQEKDTWTQLIEFFNGSSEEDLNLFAKIRLANKWKAASKTMRTISRMENNLRYISTAEGLQARLPFLLVGE